MTELKIVNNGIVQGYETWSQEGVFHRKTLGITDRSDIPVGYPLQEGDKRELITPIIQREEDKR